MRADEEGIVRKERQHHTDFGVAVVVVVAAVVAVVVDGKKDVVPC